MVLFFSFISLILWLKAYVAFNDLHNLKILLYECKMSFKIGSLWGVWNILWKNKFSVAEWPLPPNIHTHTHTHTYTPAFLGDNIHSQILKRDEKRLVPEGT